MLRDLIVKNFGWKLLSLALAAAIWLTVKAISNETLPQTDRVLANLPVRAVSAGTNAAAFEIHPGVVRVIVRGQPAVIHALTGREIRAFVDVTAAEAARDSRQRVDVSLPTRVTLVKVEPAEVEVVAPRPKPPTHSKP
jgi:hypothetical protein